MAGDGRRSFTTASFGVGARDPTAGNPGRHAGGAASRTPRRGQGAPADASSPHRRVAGAVAACITCRTHAHSHRSRPGEHRSPLSSAALQWRATCSWADTAPGTGGAASPCRTRPAPVVLCCTAGLAARTTTSSRCCALADGGRPGRALRPARQRPPAITCSDPAVGVLDGRPVQARADLRCSSRSALDGRYLLARPVVGWHARAPSTPSTGLPGAGRDGGCRLAGEPCRSGSRRPQPRCATAPAPADVQAMLTRARAGRHDGLAPGYMAAVDVFNHATSAASTRGPSRLAAGPSPLMLEDPTVYGTMIGPSEFHCHGDARRLGHHGAPGGDRDADAADLGLARRGRRRASSRTSTGASQARHGALRGLEPHAAPRGARPPLLRRSSRTSWTATEACQRPVAAFALAALRSAYCRIEGRE